MTKEDFLKRCETIYNKGYADRKYFNLLYRWVDFVIRFEHTFFTTMGHGQGSYVWDFLESERERVGYPNPQTLANDVDGYALQEIAAILDHPCQQCSEDKNVWHTRYAFCIHKKDKL